eukprot:102494-Chlamydomonas_euryale.AAC.1
MRAAARRPAAPTTAWRAPASTAVSWAAAVPAPPAKRARQARGVRVALRAAQRPEAGDHAGQRGGGELGHWVVARQQLPGRLAGRSMAGAAGAPWPADTSP